MHCRKGKPLVKGSKVMIPATVTETPTTDTNYCNVTVATDHPMGEGDPNAQPTTLVLNTRQTYSADALDEPNVDKDGNPETPDSPAEPDDE